MLLQPKTELPTGSHWLYELKLDGYRAIAFKTGGRVYLRSRNDNDFSGRYPALVKALADLPDETIIDGEVVALDESGRPSFNALQSSGASSKPSYYFVFDLMMLEAENLTGQPLERRRQLLQQKVLPRLKEPIRLSLELQADVADLVGSVKAQGLEGLVAKRRDSRYEPGQRSGAWQKMRVNHVSEFVIGGYTPSAKNFDALIFGHYDNGKPIYVARTRNGFTPLSRDQLFQRFRGLGTTECPFVNLPEKHAGRWCQGLTATKMAECRWLKPVLIGKFEFLEYTPDNHLRHSRFVALCQSTGS